ncbi:MAG: acyl-CoA dehydrogenase family protein [Candidatus Bathyarchaeia archaeon]
MSVDELTEEQKLIVQSAREIIKKFNPEYWREKDRKKEWPREFHEALTEAGFFGILIPEKYGGSGFGLKELILAVEELTKGGAGAGAYAQLLLPEVFGGVTLVKHGTEEQKEKYLPRIVKGEVACLALTEPEAGVNTFKINTMAVRDGNEYVINGRKIWISGVDKSKLMVLVARTSPYDPSKKTHGLSIFLVDLPNDSIEITPIEKHGWNWEEAFNVYINDLRVPKENLLGGKEGQGWWQIVDTLNPERIMVAIAAYGIGDLAIRKAVEYANRRVVFEAPIGSYQGIQFPLAKAKANLEASKLLVYKAADLFDKGKPCFTEACMAALTAIEAGIEAVFYSMQAFGSYSYALEYDVERWWREVLLFRLAPIPYNMLLNEIARFILGMPKSY